ncbi:MAG: SAM-dependent chlorinase/fluorinase [Thermoplasmata archaeon]|nr:SAM-dependent chlorinase/fluorinase [Thermoplasmata archaeon]MCI4355129.1 SAM-dependent chlorinase/fluorinase [Thermoplasmata archaeon]
MARRRLVTLTTDLGSAYAAQMKAVLYRSLAPDHVIDIAHDLPAHGIDEAAFLLRHIGAAFPSGTVHVAVVDPGVGGARAPIAVRCADGSILVGPDNGILYPLAHHLGPRSTVRIDPARANPGGVVSATFEGRDVFAPAAARLATGTRLSALGRPHALTARVARPPRWRGGWAVGRVVHIDRFGNAITNIPTEWFPTTPSELRLRSGTRVRRVPRRRTYAELPRAGVGVLGSSFGTLEVSAHEARAVDRLPLTVGRTFAISESAPRADGKYRRP